MKNKLICQTTNYDCGPTSITNAMRFLFEREEIPPVIMKSIWTMGIDTFAEDGEPGKEGTSKASMRYMAAWFECFSQKCHFPLKTMFLDMEYAVIGKGSLVWKCLERGGCAVVRCWHRKTGHYVLLTQLVSDEVIGLFDHTTKTRGTTKRTGGSCPTIPAAKTGRSAQTSSIEPMSSTTPWASRSGERCYCSGDRINRWNCLIIRYSGDQHVCRGGHWPPAFAGYASYLPGGRRIAAPTRFYMPIFILRPPHAFQSPACSRLSSASASAAKNRAAGASADGSAVNRGWWLSKPPPVPMRKNAPGAMVR